LSRSAFRKVGERPVHDGHLISVAVAEFEGPDGGKFERDVVRHPGAVSVVAVDENRVVTMVRQYRAAIEGDLLEIPAGKRDVAGEPPEATARRELVEEVGLRAGRVELLAEFYNSPGFCDERSFTFMALDLEPCENDLQGPEEQAMTIERVSLDDVPDLIRAGRITDAKSIIGLLMAREALA
jgi:8-oxo-dGTP pyrophosphatase MutT (NUDIX family)